MVTALSLMKVLDLPKIDPGMGKLMDEKRARVEPATGRDVRII
jgi:hypothetical protein